MILAVAAAAPDAAALRVRVEIAPGPHFAGEGFELRVGVVAAGQRPEVEPPRIAGADIWRIGTGLKPISVSGIGAAVDQSNLFLSRFRVVARRPGALEIPAIRARLGDRSGRSRPLRVPIRPVPPLGRPAEFLGGVGRFALRAEVTPPVVRVGQELDFRITVTGPAAWGMVERPELKRFGRLPIGVRIEPGPDEPTYEPPSRTFVYRLRPTRPGEAVLPPVAIAAFDPSLSRYITQVTAGLPVRVVAVPVFDPATIEDREPVGPSTGLEWTAGGVAAVLLLGGAAGLVWVRRRRRSRRPRGPAAARRYAARLARSLGTARPIPGRVHDLVREPAPRDGSGGPRPPGGDAAYCISAAMVRYLELGLGRPPGALTPDEARQGVAACTGSDALGARAAQLAARCDSQLYRAAPAPPQDDPDRLLDEARGLFAALGRNKGMKRQSLGPP